MIRSPFGDHDQRETTPFSGPASVCAPVATSKIASCEAMPFSVNRCAPIFVPSGDQRGAM